MVQFNLFGISIKVEPMFWLTIGLLGAFGSRMESSSDLLGIALFVMAAFISILVHEMGHALTIKKFGLPTYVVLTTMGGYATHPPGRLSRKQSFIVSAAGPFVQIVLGLIVLFWVFPYFVGQNVLIREFFSDLAIVSIVWAIFNCMPIYPLDGGQMLGAILGTRRTKTLHLVSMITAGILGVLGLMSGQLFIMLFMGMFFYQNLQQYQRYQ